MLTMFRSVQCFGSTIVYLIVGIIGCCTSPCLFIETKINVHCSDCPTFDQLQSRLGPKRLPPSTFLWVFPTKGRECHDMYGMKFEAMYCVHTSSAMYIMCMLKRMVRAKCCMVDLELTSHLPRFFGALFQIIILKC